MTKREQTKLAVRRALKARGKTQNWLAGRVGIKKSHMSDVISGKRAPSLKVAIAIQRETGVPADRFALGA